MPETQSLAERVAVLEEEVRLLRQQMGLERTGVSGKTASDFLQRFSGIFADDPSFPEAVRLGRDWREGDKPQDEDASPQ